MKSKYYLSIRIYFYLILCGILNSCGSSDQWIQALGAFSEGMTGVSASMYSGSSSSYTSTGSSSSTKEWHNCSSCSGNGRCKYCGGSGKDSYTRDGRCGVCRGNGKCAGCNGKGGWRI